MPTTLTEPFIARHDLWTAEQHAAAEDVLAQLDSLEQIRIGWGDQHGIVRGKALTPRELARSLREGKDFQTATLIMDTANVPSVPPFGHAGFGVEAMTGLPDAVLVPDPTTFRVLPWAERTGWMLADLHFRSGEPVPFCTRGVLRRQLTRLAELGYGYRCGVEMEFYVTRLLDPHLAPAAAGYPPDPPTVEVLAHGYQYLTDNRLDEADAILRILQRTCEALGLPLCTIEDEWGPGQCEFTFSPMDGAAAADAVLLFRSAVKQVCRRHGYHATFMARPALENFFSSGWHLHQSLVDLQSGDNAFASEDAALSPTARAFLGGLLEHARAASVFTTPTINGYKRFRPDSFAPDKVAWAFENRGAMIRVCGQAGDDSTHLENRAGEPAANPYLYLASQIASGLDGLERQLDCGEPVSMAYTAQRPALPTSLMQATEALRADPLFARAFGQPFIDYLLTVKASEISRFLATVTDWEQREYFEVY